MMRVRFTDQHGNVLDFHIEEGEFGATELSVNIASLHNGNITAIFEIDSLRLDSATSLKDAVDNDAGADPYIKPMYGSVYKLPDADAVYRLIQTHSIVVNDQVQAVD